MYKLFFDPLLKSLKINLIWKLKYLKTLFPSLSLINLREILFKICTVVDICDFTVVDTWFHVNITEIPNVHVFTHVSRSFGASRRKSKKSKILFSAHLSLMNTFAIFTWFHVISREFTWKSHSISWYNYKNTTFRINEKEYFCVLLLLILTFWII